MSTAIIKDKTIPVEQLEHVQIEAGSPRFIPPAETLLPKELHAARAAVVTCREAWLRALDRARECDRIADDAKAVHRSAQNRAALDGLDVMAVPDERPAKYAAQAAATEASEASVVAIETRWRDLVDAIAAHRDQITGDLKPHVDDAEQQLAKLEKAAADQRIVTERLRAQHQWLSTIGRSSQNRATTENGSPFK